MGRPFFSWRPHTSAAGRVHIDVGEDLTDLQVTPIRQVVDGLPVGGRFTRTMLRPAVSVRVVHERFTDRELFRKYSAMINHLERGGVVAFGVDDAKAFGATIVSMSVPQGSVRFTVGPNLFKDYAVGSSSLDRPTGSTTAPFGDEIIVESKPPVAAREYHTVYSATEITGGSRIDIDATTGSAVTNQRAMMDWRVGDLVRYSDFWPYCYLPQGSVGGALLTHDHRISYTLDLSLEYIIPDLDEWDTPPINEQGVPGFDGSGITKEPEPNDPPDLGQGHGYVPGGKWTLKKKSAGGLSPYDIPMLDDMLK